MSDTTLEISVPADDDGYVLLQCSLCGEYFKLRPDDYEDDGVLELYCPACGLSGETFMTEEVFELAQEMAENYAMDLLFGEMKKWEKQFSKGAVTFKAGKKPAPKPETPIRAGIEALEITRFRCCKRNAKVKPLLKMTGCCCPFCGVKEYEPE